MDDDEIKDLIAELKTLKIRASIIIDRLESVSARRTSVASTSNTTTHNAVNNERELTVNGLKSGDRVRIRNKVNKPATWPTEKAWIREEARLATVTRVTRQQIHFVTDNGISTWRAPNNLERLI
jgi:lipopolysaccharide biosynthesis protein